MSVADISSFAPAADRLARTHILRVALLMLVSLGMFLPGFVRMPAMDRDEPRFAQATRQMIETGDFVSIRFQDDARNKKPVGIYVLQAGAVALATLAGVPDAQRTIWVYRLPSLIGALATVALTYWAALALTTADGALIAALLLASTILMGVEARLAKTDAVLAATTVAAMGALARIYLTNRTRRLAGRLPDARGKLLPAIFWTAIGLGILVKGPITPLVPLLALVWLGIRERSAGWMKALHPIQGLIWIALLILPWFSLIMWRTNGAFLSDSIGGDMIGKISAGREMHGAPPGTYLLAFLVTAWPLSPFALLIGPAIFRSRRADEIAFLLAWIVPAWLLFELVPTKLPHYVLPLYPAIAIATAVGLLSMAKQTDIIWRRRAARLLGLVPALIAMIGIGIAAWLHEWPDLKALAALGGLALLVWQGLRSWCDLSMRNQIVLSTGMALALYVCVYEGLLVSTFSGQLDVSARLALARDSALKAEPGCARLAAATTSFREPSLVLATDTDLKMTDASGAAAFLAEGACRIAFVDWGEEADFLKSVANRTDIHRTARVEGYNINRSRHLDIGAYVRGSRP